MEQKIVYSGGLKGIQRTKPSVFTSFDMHEELRMAVLEAGGLYKLRKPLPSALDTSTSTYRSLRNVTGLRPRGMAYLESPTPSIVYFYGDKCFYVKPIESISDRIKFDYTADTSIWTGKGSVDGNKYKWVKFHSAADDDYLFCCAGNSLEWIKISDWTTGTVAVLPTTGCTAVWVKDSRLWCAIGDKLFYSTVDDGLTFDATHFLRLFENDVVCDAAVYNDVSFIFTDKYIYYMTGNDTDDFIVKIMENTQCILDSTFDTDSEGIYFMDKYANVRLISSSPNYNSAAKSLVISNNLNLYDKFISNNLQYPSFINIARNQEKLFVNMGVATQFTLTNLTIDATKDSGTDFLEAGTWTETLTAGTTTKTVSSFLTDSGAAQKAFLETTLNPANCDLTFQLYQDSANNAVGYVSISNTEPDGGITKGFSIEANSTTEKVAVRVGDGGASVAHEITGFTWAIGKTFYCRALVTDYNSTAKTATISVWVKQTDPLGSWGTANYTESGVTFNMTWKMFVESVNSGGKFYVKNLLYVEGGIIGSTSLNSIYNFIFDMKTKEWTEYANFDAATGLVKEYPIEYMSPSKDRVLNTAQYLGCQYTETVGVYTDTKNFIGVFNQKGTTKDSSSMYILSDPFNLETPNKKILREFYADFTPTDAVVSLHLQNEVDFASAVTSIMSIRSGWNTIPRTYRGRQFKWGITTTETDEFQLKQIGFRFDDLGQKAF